VFSFGDYRSSICSPDHQFQSGPGFVDRTNFRIDYSEWQRNVFALLSLGLLVATKAENQMQALQMSMTFIMPSGLFLRFHFSILRGASFLEYLPALAIMSIMAVLLSCICALRFRKKIG
jgi:hypothetical protein